MKEYNETPKEMAAKIRQLFSEHCSSSLNDDAIFTTERAEKECALIYIKGIIENAYIKWLMPEDTNNPFLKCSAFLIGTIMLDNRNHPEIPHAANTSTHCIISFGIIQTS